MDSETIESPSAHVYLEYDPANPPPRPGPQWTRFVCISDTHSHFFPVPDGDVLLHSGDLTETGTLRNFEVTMDWLRKLPHHNKIIIAGNHDLTLHRGWYGQNYSRWHGPHKQDEEKIMDLVKGEEAHKAGIVYLEDEEYDFQAKEDGRVWSVYGSPGQWSPWFYDWAFNYNPGAEAERLLAKFPKTDILLTKDTDSYSLTHGPPHNVLDSTLAGDHVGCPTLAAHMQKLRPRIHLFGHIHEGHGAELREWSQGESTIYVNAANWPMGPRAEEIRSKGVRPTFGGPGFRPIIVDLLD
ncbi:Metallo-dependent phosphatase [Heliocybe sulcata]|uniref:Metallo-dependent phosphatase n=1 Tax=Heliocybe sulcata TaxID=5364 RepID=A0A5C3NBU4_9AGAM|nr:Metallo-dependent phosphatase [Heliocybe sulcata]